MFTNMTGHRLLQAISISLPHTVCAPLHPVLQTLSGTQWSITQHSVHIVISKAINSRPCWAISPAVNGHSNCKPLFAISLQKVLLKCAWHGDTMFEGLLYKSVERPSKDEQILCTPNVLKFSYCSAAGPEGSRQNIIRMVVCAMRLMHMWCSLSRILVLLES